MSNVENVCPQVLRGVTRELRRLAANPPSGIKLVLRDDDLTDVVALIDGPADTPYAGGVFRVRLALGREFPAAPPRAYFLTKIFHPNVSAAGEVCVNTLKRDWRPELGLEHALLAVKCLLIAPNADSALNAEAAALLRDRYDDYFARAKLYTDIHAGAGRAAGGGAGGVGARGGGVRRSLPNMATSHLLHEPAKLYPYHLLLITNYRLPPDVDRLNLERHLSDAEFEAILQVGRQDFYRLPQWRRNELKRRARLF